MGSPDTHDNSATPTSRRNMIKAGTAAGIVAVGLPSAAAAVSVDGTGALVATGGFDAPASVTATASELVSRAVNVSWQTVSGATEYQVKYRINGTSDPYTVGGETSGTTLQVTDLTNGVTYQFVVVATNGTSVSFDSAPATAMATQLAPGVPTSISATGTNGAVDVSWAPPTSGGSVTTYEVRWSATDGSGWTTITGLSPSTFAQTVSGLTNGTTYYFQVRGINALDGGWSTSVSAVPVASAEAQIASPPEPQPPVVGVTTTSNSVTIHTDSNSTPTWNYSYSTDNGSNWTPVVVNAENTSFIVSGITTSSQTIKVRKENGGAPATSTVSLTRMTPTYAPGQVYSITNPDSVYGVRGVTFTAKGGSGNKGGNDGGTTGGNGGKGGLVVGSFTFDANETLYIAAGSGGSAGSTGTNFAGGVGGTNALTGYAGGRGGNSGRKGSSGSGGGGGGATVLRKGTTGSVTQQTATTIIIAGGGGGGGGADSTAGTGGAYRLSTTSGTNGAQGGTPPGGSDDGGGGGGGGGGAAGGVGGSSQYISESGVFTKTYYYRGNGASAGSNSVAAGVTTTTNGEDSAALVNGAAGSVALDYLAVTWTSG